MSALFDNDFPLRTLDDIDEIPNCALCSRGLKRVESHWHCIICRKEKKEAKCPNNCKACIALFEEKWRYNSLSKLEKENLKKKLFPFNFDVCDRPKGNLKIFEPVKPNEGTNSNSSSLKCANKSIMKRKAKQLIDLGDSDLSNSKISLKSNEVESQECLNTLCSKPIDKKIKKVKIEMEIKEGPADDPFMKRLKSFETFLYQDLAVTLPKELVCDKFKMPEIPSYLILKFKVLKSELVRLLATASVSYHLSKNIDQIGSDEGLKMLDVCHATNEFIGVELYASLIKFKANSLAQVIFQIRESILSKVFCKDESIIPLMIRGPINPAISFFGNFDALQKAVKRDKRNVLILRNE